MTTEDNIALWLLMLHATWFLSPGSKSKMDSPKVPICLWFFLHQLNLGDTTTNNNFQELCGAWWVGRGGKVRVER